MQHKHHDCIVAWARGATIQVLAGHQGWIDALNNNPAWREDTQYRIKPEPDVIKYLVLDMLEPIVGFCYNTKQNLDNYKCQQLCLIFDGETGMFKSAEAV